MKIKRKLLTKTFITASLFAMGGLLTGTLINNNNNNNNSYQQNNNVVEQNVQEYSSKSKTTLCDATRQHGKATLIKGYKDKNVRYDDAIFESGFGVKVALDRDELNDPIAQKDAYLYDVKGTINFFVSGTNREVSHMTRRLEGKDYFFKGKDYIIEQGRMTFDIYSVRWGSTSHNPDIRYDIVYIVEEYKIDTKTNGIIHETNNPFEIVEAENYTPFTGYKASIQTEPTIKLGSSKNVVKVSPFILSITDPFVRNDNFARLGNPDGSDQVVGHIDLVRRDESKEEVVSTVEFNHDNDIVQPIMRGNAGPTGGTGSKTFLTLFEESTFKVDQNLIPSDLSVRLRIDNYQFYDGVSGWNSDTQTSYWMNNYHQVKLTTGVDTNDAVELNKSTDSITYQINLKERQTNKAISKAYLEDTSNYNIILDDVINYNDITVDSSNIEILSVIGNSIVGGKETITANDYTITLKIKGLNNDEFRNYDWKEFNLKEGVSSDSQKIDNVYFLPANKTFKLPAVNSEPGIEVPPTNIPNIEPGEKNSIGLIVGIIGGVVAITLIITLGKYYYKR